MSEYREKVIDNSWVLSKRGDKNYVDPKKPYAWLVEKEIAPSGKLEDIATIFLTNKECPFRCLMCDLWKNTTNTKVAIGDIPEQIEWALNQMPKTKHLKLYNSGSFFDKNAIPEEDYQKIATLIRDFESVIVESHPRFINERCIQFKNMIQPELQVAIGLESIHLGVIEKLNKQMSLEDFKKSVEFLTLNNISSRAFILLRPPFLSESEGVHWAKRTIDFAFNSGVACCIVIPVRAGNGAMESLMKSGDFETPTIQSLENVLDYGIGLKLGQVFADTWDLELFSNCDLCFDKRLERLKKMNDYQQVEKIISCKCTSH